MDNDKPTSLPIQVGNTTLDSAETRGWIVGSFLPKESGLRHSDDVEIKWGVHKKGETRAEWTVGETRTTIGVLVSGKFELEFRDRAISLINSGDYVMWGPGVDHKWRALDDCVLVTIRWPSAS